LLAEDRSDTIVLVQSASALDAGDLMIAWVRERDGLAQVV
jgi:hypothetical protein